MNENGSVVPLEKILESLPNVNDFGYTFGFVGNLSSKIISSKTVSELLKIPHFSNLTYFTLFGIPEAFDIETFYEYIKKNKNTKIWLQFHDEISDAYKTRLKAIAEEIIDDENRDYKAPMIRFLGITRPLNDKLHMLYTEV